MIYYQLTDMQNKMISLANESYHTVIDDVYYFIFFQLIPQITSLSPVTTILPLVVVLAVSAIKDAADDIVSIYCNAMHRGTPNPSRRRMNC
jgi:hypothetical protein